MTQKKQIAFFMISTLALLGMSCSKKDTESTPPAPAETRQIVLDPPFDRADNFSCGFALVNVGRWGYIDE